jgi:hypothetical protein
MILVTLSNIISSLSATPHIFIISCLLTISNSDIGVFLNVYQLTFSSFGPTFLAALSAGTKAKGLPSYFTL